MENKKVDRYYIHKGTAYPVELGDIEWKLRYAEELTKEDRLYAASIIAKFNHFQKLTQKELIEYMKDYKNAVKASIRHEG